MATAEQPVPMADPSWVGHLRPSLEKLSGCTGEMTLVLQVCLRWCLLPVTEALLRPANAATTLVLQAGS